MRLLVQQVYDVSAGCCHSRGWPAGGATTCLANKASRSWGRDQAGHPTLLHRRAATATLGANHTRRRARSIAGGRGGARERKHGDMGVLLWQVPGQLGISGVNHASRAKSRACGVGTLLGCGIKTFDQTCHALLIRVRHGGGKSSECEVEEGS